MWNQWIQRNWSRLESGEHLQAPAWFPHPKTQGFKPVEVSTPKGQVADWALSYNDESRIHIREFEDGRFMVHRDRHDPEQGIENMISHLLTETFVGPAVFLTLVLVAANNSG